MNVNGLFVLAPPILLNVLPDSVRGLWNTVALGNSEYSVGGNTSGTYPVNQDPTKLFDYSLTSRYTSLGDGDGSNSPAAGLKTGFYATVGWCPSILKGFIISTCSNAQGRDPLQITIEGSMLTTDLNNGSIWTKLYDGLSGLLNTTNRSADGEYVDISNSDIYRSYRFLVTSKRGNNAPSVCYSEVKLYGHSVLGELPDMSGKYILHLCSEK